MHLKTLAKRWQTADKEIVYFMLGYTTLRNDIVVDDFEALVPRDRWSLGHYAFISFTANVIDLEFADTLNDQHAALAMYWENRTGNMADDWNLFTSLIGDEACIEISVARENIRDTAISQAPVTGEEAKKKPGASGTKPASTLKAQRGPKVAVRA